MTLTSPDSPRSAERYYVTSLPKKKLIEVSLPLEAVNRAAERETRIRSGHPKSIHQWWSRKPLSISRSILFAQMVDDPSSDPVRFPSEAEQDAEREKLHALLVELAEWNESSDSSVLDRAREEIRRSNGGVIPEVLDPFAGAGSIPIEAQRLGARAHASDLNPVAVLMNRALIQGPQLFSGMKPVHPEAADQMTSWVGAQGIAEDLKKYGEWIRDRAFERIGHLYPKVVVPGGTEQTVISWIWARTVNSPNPANPIETPLVTSWWLSKKKGRETFIKPEVVNGSVQYRVQKGKTGVPSASVNRGNGISIADGTPFSASYVRSEAIAGRMGKQLMAIAAEGARSRIYVEALAEHAEVAEVEAETGFLDFEMPNDPRAITAPNYGVRRWSDLYTGRQLKMLGTMLDLVGEVRDIVLSDARQSGLQAGGTLSESVVSAEAYADLVALYLGLAVDKLADLNNSMVSWEPVAECPRHLFVRPAIPMVWEFAEANPFSNSSGSFMQIVKGMARIFPTLGPWDIGSEPGVVSRADASTRNYRNLVVSTDPPYYDVIGYADLSDFFYLLLRKSLGGIFPADLDMMLSPKQDEIVANATRHGGKAESAEFFIEKFNSVFGAMRENGVLAPMTVYYAYKQKDSSDGSFTGWQTLLNGLIGEGWEVTATWPVLTEGSGRLRAHSSNALESTVVLACRPRPEAAPIGTRRDFMRVLKTELPEALRRMMKGAISPVDLAQAAIGPGISVFSRYSRVRESDGSDMTVREALQVINGVLDEVLDEQESDFDSDTRFAIKWYRQYGWDQENSGIADQLARSTDTSVGALERGGIFEAKGGKARLLAPSQLDGVWDVAADANVSVWEAAVRLAAVMAKDGADKVAELLPAVQNRVNLDAVKELGFLLFHEAEKKKDTQDAVLFNGLVSAWGDLNEQARKIAATTSSEGLQQKFDFEDMEG